MRWSGPWPDAATPHPDRACRPDGAIQPATPHRSLLRTTRWSCTRSPLPESSSDFDDWLRWCSHTSSPNIVHLDRSEGWARVRPRHLRRTPVCLPQSLSAALCRSRWLATLRESSDHRRQAAFTPGDFGAIVGEAARRGRSRAARYRVNGGFDRLACRPRRLRLRGRRLPSVPGRSIRGRIAGVTLPRPPPARVPYMAAPAFMGVYKESLGSLWRDYEASLTATVRRPARARSVRSRG